MSSLGNFARFCSVTLRASKRLYRVCASVKLAVVLLALLAAILAVATFLEAGRGSEYARWYVYGSVWFSGLLALLGANILAATMVRFPWKRRQAGFVVTHAGLLVLLVGSIQSLLGGIEGSVSLQEGQATNEMMLAERSQIVASWVGRSEEAPYEFNFSGGPVNWPEDKHLDFGTVDGVSAKILRYYPHSRLRERWLPDEEGNGWPLVRFTFQGPDGNELTEAVLADQGLGAELFVGPIRMQLQRTFNQRMFEDFQAPMPDDLGPSGTLFMYYRDDAKQVAVQEHVGKTISIGDDGTEVEIVEYLANARAGAMGSFQSKGESPANPMLELRVSQSDGKPSMRQIAFAKSPLLNLDGVYARNCPVKFRYHHPELLPSAEIEFLQVSDGKLYCRVAEHGVYRWVGEIGDDTRIEAPAQFKMQISEYLPQATQKVDFVPATGSVKDNEDKVAAAHLEVAAGGVTRRVWLQRGDPRMGTQVINTPQGPMQWTFQDGRVPLGFSIKLLDFHQELNPGRIGNAGFSSRVQVMDAAGKGREERTISMNEPLRHGKWTFYQSGFSDAGHGQQISSFSVAHDPGRFLKYLGSLMICTGIAFMFYMRAYFFQYFPIAWRRRQSNRGAREGVEWSLERDSAVPKPSGHFTALLSESTSDHKIPAKRS